MFWIGVVSIGVILFWAGYFLRTVWDTIRDSEAAELEDRP